MKNTKILLIGGTGGSVSEGLYKCLNMAGYQDITLLAHRKDAALIYRIKNHIIIDKNPDHGYDYIKTLIQTCRSNNINVVVPGSTWESKIISKYNNEFNNEHITCLVNNQDVIDICSDKRKTYEFLSSHGFGTPKTFTNAEESLSSLNNKIHLIVKPAFGWGSKNIFRVASVAELKATLNYFEVMNIPYIIQEYITDEQHEYTVGVVSDKNGLSIQSLVMQRFLFGGATGYAKVMTPGHINTFCENLARQIKSTGPLNIQLRLDENKNPVVFEINPRFSGSAPMRALAGFNELDLLLKNFCFDQAITAGPINFESQYYRCFQEIQIQPNSMTGEIKNFL